MVAAERSASKIHHLTALTVHDDRAVVGALSPCPIVNASNTDCCVIGPSLGMLLEAAQDRRVAAWHAQPSQASLRWPSARAMAQQPNNVRQPFGLASERRRNTRQALGENAPIAPLISTSPARDTRLDDGGRSLGGQIPKRSPVRAVTRSGLHTTSWTGARLSAVRHHRPARFSPLNAQPSSWEQATRRLMFSSPFLGKPASVATSRGDVRRAQPTTHAPRLNQTPSRWLDTASAFLAYNHHLVRRERC